MNPVMALLGEPHFPFFWISSLQRLFPQPLRTDDLEQIRCIQGRQQSKHKGNLPSSVPQSDKNAVALFTLSRIFGIISEAWQGRERGNMSVGSLGMRSPLVASAEAATVLRLRLAPTDERSCHPSSETFLSAAHGDCDGKPIAGQNTERN